MMTCAAKDQQLHSNKQILECLQHRGSNMTAHVLLNLLSCRKRNEMQGSVEHFITHNEYNKIGAQMSDSIRCLLPIDISVWLALLTKLGK